MKIEGGNNGFLGMVNEIGVVRNVAFANVQVSANAGLFCVFGGTIENVIVHGTKTGASAGWGLSSILIGKIVNAKAVVKNVVVIHNGTLSENDGLVYGKGDGGKPYALTDVYAVCAESQKIAVTVGDKAVNTRVMAKASVDELAADESKSFAGFSGWDMSKGIPLSQAIIDVMYPAAE